MSNNQTKKTILSAVFCSLVFTMTWISIPAPSVGNINLGDCMVILSGCLLGSWYGVAAAALGAALCDLVSGYVIYAPGTFIIKAFMVLVIILMRKFILKNNKYIVLIISSAIAEVVMILGYFLYEAIVLQYSFAAIMNVPFNAIQGVVNLIVAVILFAVLKKLGLLKMILEDRQIK